MEPPPLAPVLATTTTTSKHPRQQGPRAIHNRHARGRRPRALALLALVLGALACACIQTTGALPTPAAGRHDTSTVVPARLALPSNTPLLPHSIHRRNATATNATMNVANSTARTSTTPSNSSLVSNTTTTATSAASTTAAATRMTPPTALTTTAAATSTTPTTTLTLAMGENGTTNGTLTPVGSGTDKDPWYQANLYYIAGGGGGLLLLVIIIVVVAVRCGRCSCCRCRCGKAVVVDDPSSAPSSTRKRSDRKRGVHVDTGFAFDQEGEHLEMHDLLRGHRRSGVTTMDAYAPAHAHGYTHPPATRRELQDVLGKHAQTFKSAQLTILESLGSGQYTHTHRGLLDKHANHTDPEAVDVKTPLNDAGTIKLLQEAAIASQFSHRKVLRLVGLVLDRREGMVAMYEHMEKGPLDRVLRRSSVSLAEKVSMMSDVAQGLHYLACCNFVVGDLMAQHVMVGPDYVCKISGFGMSRDASDATNTACDQRYRWAAQELLPPPHLVATVSWRKSGDSGLEALAASGGGTTTAGGGPPQQHVPGCYTTASDVWAFGVVMWEVLSDGDLPHGHLSDSKIVTSVLAGERLPPPAQCPVELYRLMMACWHPSSRHRPALDDIVSRLAHERTVVAAHTKAPAVGGGGGAAAAAGAAAATYRSTSSVGTVATVTTALDVGDGKAYASVGDDAGSKKHTHRATSAGSNKQTKDTLTRIQNTYLRLSASPSPPPPASARSPELRSARRTSHQPTTTTLASTSQPKAPAGAVTSAITTTTAATTATVAGAAGAAGAGRVVSTSRRGSDELATRSAATSGIESMAVSDETRAARGLGVSKTAPRRFNTSPAVPSPLAPSATEPTFVRVFNGNAGAAGSTAAAEYQHHQHRQHQHQHQHQRRQQRAPRDQQWSGPPVVVEGEDSYLTILPHGTDVSKTFPRMRPPIQPHNQQQQQQQQQQQERGRDTEGDTCSGHDHETHQTKLEGQSKAVSSPTLAPNGFHLPLPSNTTTTTTTSSFAPRRQRPVSATTTAPATRSSHSRGATSELLTTSSSSRVSKDPHQRRRYHSDTAALQPAANDDGGDDDGDDGDDGDADAGDKDGRVQTTSSSSSGSASPGKTALAVALEGVKKEPGEACVITPPRPRSEHFPAAGPRPHLPPLVPYQRVPVLHASPGRPALSRQASLEAESDGDSMGAVQAALEEAIAAGEASHRQQTSAHGHHHHHVQHQHQHQHQQGVSTPRPSSPGSVSRRSSGGSAVALRPPVVAGQPQERQDRPRRLLQMCERSGDGAATAASPLRGARGSASIQRMRRDHVVADTPVLPASHQHNQQQLQHAREPPTTATPTATAAASSALRPPRGKNAAVALDDMALMSEAERAPPGQELAMMDRVHGRFPLVAQGSVESSDSAPSRATHASLSAVDTIRSSPFSSRGSTERGRAFPILSRGASLDTSQGGGARSSSSPRRLSPAVRLGAGSPHRAAATAPTTTTTAGGERGGLPSTSSTSEGGATAGPSPTEGGTTSNTATAAASETSIPRASLLTRGRGTVFSRLRQLAAPWSTRGGGEFVPEPDATTSVTEAWANPASSSSPASHRSSVLMNQHHHHQQDPRTPHPAATAAAAATATVLSDDAQGGRRERGDEADDGADGDGHAETNEPRVDTEAAAPVSAATATVEHDAPAHEAQQEHGVTEGEADAHDHAVTVRPSSPPPGVLPGSMPS